MNKLKYIIIYFIIIYLYYLELQRVNISAHPLDSGTLWYIGFAWLSPALVLNMSNFFFFLS